MLPNYGPKPQVVMVSATTIREGIPHDAACELQVGEHPFVQHPSYIAYRYARVDQVEHVESMVQSATWKTHEPCSQHLLQRIRDGMQTSKLAPREIKGFF